MQYMQAICSYASDFAGICTRTAISRYMHPICKRYARNMQPICTIRKVYATDMQLKVSIYTRYAAICKRYATICSYMQPICSYMHPICCYMHPVRSYMQGICTRYALYATDMHHMQAICNRYATDMHHMQGICNRYAAKSRYMHPICS
jgi:hypothetical protein